MKTIPNSSPITITFWGVRGSVPSPITGAQVSDKIAHALHTSLRQPIANDADEADVRHWMNQNLTFPERSTFGGNTTCVEIQCDGVPLILDMGTGLRELGRMQMRRMFQEGDRKLHGYIFQSHVHWDHIQGFPFWGPVFAPRKEFDVNMTFFGGKAWDAKLETVLAGQMDAPLFPVNFEEIRATGMNMTFETVHDNWSVELEGPNGPIHVTARKLNHPDETFGYRVEYQGRVVTFTTDHEPYAYADTSALARPLLDLVDHADLWITDCQYSHECYAGKVDGVQKCGWGHSFPEYIADVARIASPYRVITTHHDPNSSDVEVERIARQVYTQSSIETFPAYEGLVIPVHHPVSLTA